MSQSQSELIQRVTRLNRLITQRTGRTRPAQVHTQLQLESLTFIEAHKVTQVSQIAKHLGISLSSVAQLLRRLDRAGWIERAIAVHDRRHVTVRLTTRGDQHLRQLTKHRRQEFTKLFRGVSAAQLKIMADVMAIMYRNALHTK